MVKTYKFNPSIQSSDFMSEPKPSYQPSYQSSHEPSYHAVNPFISTHPSMYSPEYMHESRPSREASHHAVNPFISNHPSMTPLPQHSKHFISEDDDCPFSQYYKPPPIPNHDRHSTHNKQAFEDETTVFGIRSIVIDGERFYQPVDQQFNKKLNEQFLSLKPSHNQVEPSNHNGQVSAAIMGFIEPPHDPINRQKRFVPAVDERLDKLEMNRYQRDVNERIEVELEHRNRSAKMIDDLPWARGNPQPKSGIRGSLGWSFGQRTNPFSASPPIDPLYKTYNKSWLNDPLQFGPKPPTNIYQTASQEAYSYFAPKPASYPVNLANSYTSFNSEPIATHINPYSYGASEQENKRYEKEQHRLELLRQIEDNNHRKMLDKQRDLYEDNREKWRDERTLQRQREEVQREQDEVRKRQMAAEVKAQNATVDLHHNKNGNHNHNQQSRSTPRSTPKQEMNRNGLNGSTTPKNQLEWWEKKPSWQDRQLESPALPALRTTNQQQTSLSSRQSRMDQESLTGYSVSKQNRRSASIEQPEVIDRPVSLQSRQSRSQSRNSRRSYQPSLASRADSNTTGLRNLSATRRRLEHEYSIVNAAVDKNQYDSRVFD